MKWLSVFASFGLMALLTVSTSGCKKAENKAGGGATWGSLKQPSEVEMKEGGTGTLKVTLDRAKDNKDDITVKVDPPKGVSVDPKEQKIKGAETEATFALKAADNATSGDATVTATPGDLKQTVKVRIDKKK